MPLDHDKKASSDPPLSNVAVLSRHTLSSLVGNTERPAGFSLGVRVCPPRSRPVSAGEFVRVAVWAAGMDLPS